MAAEGNPNGPQLVEINDEERAVLRECRVNSVYFRGLPLGTVSVLLMREVIKSGRVPHIKRFSSFYYPGMFALGFLSGIASYRKTCMEKIMRLENSQLADQVRSFYRKAGMTDQIIGETSTTEQTEPGFFDDSKEHLPQDDVGGHKPSFTMPNPLGLQDENTKSSDKYTSYEELRRRNRNQWMTPKQKPSTDNSRLDQSVGRTQEPVPKRDADDYRSPVDSYESDVTSADVWSESTLEDSSSQDDSTTGRGKRSSRSGPAPMKNAYGDVLEK